MVESIPGFAGIVAILVVNVGHLLKSISDNKVVKSEIKNLTEQIRRQNGSINENTHRIEDHIKTCHLNKWRNEE